MVNYRARGFLFFSNTEFMNFGCIFNQMKHFLFQITGRITLRV
ncbi:hypothetical protein JCM19235_4475 [Vibrio maritimus]|uniref:Uncharacterized protein n=1 Tax=Vibrio maritimus TaxID=990268 RepID=A0A090RXS6_9VIBR|nr:hypothetical protein JCM19235_4475 [Vibrio maritimus]